MRDISRAGKLDAAGVSAGAHSSEGPVFSLAGKQRGYRAALAAAVKQARSQAAAMAAAAGLRITGVVSIQEDQNDRYAVYGAASADALAPARVRGRSHPTRAQPGERLGDGGVRRRAGRLRSAIRLLGVDRMLLLGIEVEHLRDGGLVEPAADQQRGRAPGRGLVVRRLPELGDHQIVGDLLVGLLVAGQGP